MTAGIDENPLLQKRRGRLLKGIGFLFLGLLVLAAIFFVYPCYKDRKQTMKEARRAIEEIRQEAHESTALASLGDIKINLQDLTLRKLNEILQRPPKKLSDGGKNYTWLGWACGGDLCTVKASFLVPAGNDVPSSATPAVLFLNDATFGKPFQGSIGGIHLGDPEEKLIAICEQNGYERKNELNGISWNEDWEVRWFASDGKIKGLVFFNVTLLNRAKDPAEGPRAPIKRGDR